MQGGGALYVRQIWRPTVVKIGGTWEDNKHRFQHGLGAGIHVEWLEGIACVCLPFYYSVLHSDCPVGYLFWFLIMFLLNEILFWSTVGFDRKSGTFSTHETDGSMGLLQERRVDFHFFVAYMAYIGENIENSLGTIQTQNAKLLVRFCWIPLFALIVSAFTSATLHPRYPFPLVIVFLMQTHTHTHKTHGYWQYNILEFSHVLYHIHHLHGLLSS